MKKAKTKKVTSKNNKLTYEIVSKYRTLLMGIAIITILIFHFVEDCHSANHNYEGLIRLYKICIGSSGVDIFLLLSGFGLYYSFKKNNNIKEFYTKRFTKILIPYLIVAIPGIFFKDIIFNNGTIIDFLKDITFVSIITDGVRWHWYIFFIGLCYLIFPYIYKVFDSSKDEITDHMRLTSMFSFITIICIMLQLYCKPVFNNTNIFMLRFFPFICGVLLGKYAYQKKEIKKSHIVIAFLGLFLIWLAKDTNIILVRYTLFIVNTCLYFVGLLILNKLSNLKIHDISVKIIGWFGKYSLEIYLVHVTIRVFFKYLGYPTYILKNEIIFIILTLVLSVILNRISSKISTYITKKVST